MELRVIVMYIDDLEDGSGRDVEGMKNKVEELRAALKDGKLAKKFVINQNEEAGHEYFTVEFKISVKRVKKVIKIISKSDAYNTRIYWYSA